MTYRSLIPCIQTKHIDESRKFYIRCFNARITFDCGWYVSLRLGEADNSPELAFMSPQQPSDKPFSGAGLTYNFLVDDVDQEYNRLKEAGVTPIMPLEEHPWGDRGFGIQDPNGMMIYMYTPIEPTDEFKQYYKET